jgi:hypothetical protein
MPINKLEQLRKYIFDIDIEIERIRFEQIFNSKKLLEPQNVFDPQCIAHESTVGMILERNHKRGMLLPF